MKIAIMGDSFTHSYKNTWLQDICENLNLN